MVTNIGYYYGLLVINLNSAPEQSTQTYLAPNPVVTLAEQQIRTSEYRVLLGVEFLRCFELLDSLVSQPYQKLVGVERGWGVA